MTLSAVTDDLRSHFKIAEDVEGAVIMAVARRQRRCGKAPASRAM